MTESRPPFPPFDLTTARQKVQAAEDAWNTRDPEKVSAAYTPDSQWRNRDLPRAGGGAATATSCGSSPRTA
jgi:nuclear transport factor 2 (NTF2) superfamily protein